MADATTLAKHYKRLVAFVLFGALLAAVGGALFNPTVSAQLAPTLGAADSLSILAATTITDADPASTTISSDVASTGGGAAILVPCSSVGGNIFSVDSAPVDACVVNNSGVPAAAQAANTAAFGDLIAGPNSACTNIPVELGGQTLGPGVYCSGGVFTLSETLTLTGDGTWIFQSTASLITSGTGNVVGGNPCDVWWRLPSDAAAAVLGTNTQLTGNILAFGSITLATGATLNGRAFSQIGAVTLDGNTITTPAECAEAEESTPTSTPPFVPDSGDSSTSTPAPTATRVATPTASPAASPTTTPAAPSQGQPPQVVPPQTGDAGLLRARTSQLLR